MEIVYFGTVLIYKMALPEIFQSL